MKNLPYCCFVGKLYYLGELSVSTFVIIFFWEILLLVNSLYKTSVVHFYTELHTTFFFSLKIYNVGGSSKIRRQVQTSWMYFTFNSFSLKEPVAEHFSIILKCSATGPIKQGILFDNLKSI